MSIESLLDLIFIERDGQLGLRSGTTTFYDGKADWSDDGHKGGLIMTAAEAVTHILHRSATRFEGGMLINSLKYFRTYGINEYDGGTKNRHDAILNIARRPGSVLRGIVWVETSGGLACFIPEDLPPVEWIPSELLKVREPEDIIMKRLTTHLNECGKISKKDVMVLDGCDGERAMRLLKKISKQPGLLQRGGTVYVQK